MMSLGGLACPPFILTRRESSFLGARDSRLSFALLALAEIVGASPPARARLNLGT